MIATALCLMITAQFLQKAYSATNELCMTKAYCFNSVVELTGTFASVNACMNACLVSNPAHSYFDYYFQGSNAKKCFCGLTCGEFVTDLDTNTYSINGVSKRYFSVHISTNSYLHIHVFYVSTGSLHHFIPISRSKLSPRVSHPGTNACAFCHPFSATISGPI